MKSKVLNALIVLLLPVTAMAAVSQLQYQQIERLGRLNGVALQCRYFDQTSRIKKALITALPKRRALGNQFEVITNESFKAFIDKGATCPAEDQFAMEVDSAIVELEKAFAQ